MSTYTTPQFAPVSSVGKARKGTWRKSIIVVSLSKRALLCLGQVSLTHMWTTKL